MPLLPSILSTWPPPPPLPPPPPPPSAQTGVVAVSLPPAMAHYRCRCAAKVGFESGAISRGDLILIHANDHALSSQSPPSPPPPPPLAPPCHFILPGTATNCSHRRRQVSPPLTARLVFASCHWWRCRYACADASPRFRLAATSPSPRCSSCITMFQGMKGKFLLCRALHFASHRVMHSISLN